MSALDFLDSNQDFESNYGANLPSESVTYGNEWDLYSASMSESSARVKRSVEKLRAAELMSTLVSLEQPVFLRGRERARDLENHDRDRHRTELKETKGGFVACHFLTGKDKDAIAKDLAASFKLTEPQAAQDRAPDQRSRPPLRPGVRARPGEEVTEAHRATTPLGDPEGLFRVQTGRLKR